MENKLTEKQLAGIILSGLSFVFSFVIIMRDYSREVWGPFLLCGFIVLMVTYAPKINW